MELIAYAVAALVPVFAFYIMSLMDLYGTGKYETFFICMGWGATVAYGLSFTVNNIFIDSFGYENVTRLTAPILEEIFKSIILWYFVTRPRFRYIVDGAVYGFSAGIGFAVMENIFFISGEASALGLAVSRVLSASLMHATASALVGIGMGRLRRSKTTGLTRYGFAVAGMIFAIVVHIAYNNAVQIEDLSPQYLLLIGIGIGIGGSVLIGYIINQGLAEEKRNFQDTLGIEVGVTSSERQAVQQLGTNAVEEILAEFENFFGAQKVVKIRQLLVTQANIGILQNNLRSPSSPRMKQAWQAEVEEFRAEADELRSAIGVYVMTFLRGVFPVEDAQTWEAIQSSAAEFDPGHVHKFDVFMMAAQSSGTTDVQRLERMGQSMKAIEIFKHVDLADLENLSRAIVERSFADGRTLFAQGDEGDAMYMIDNGGIDIFIVDDATGQEKYIRTYERGAVVGEMSLLDGQTRSATARTNGDTRLLVLRRNHFMMFVNSRPRVMLAVLQFLAERVRYTTGVVEETVERAGALARGDFERARQFERERRVLDTQQRINIRSFMESEGTLEPNEAAEAAPAVLGGMFADLAQALETRQPSDDGK